MRSLSRLILPATAVVIFTCAAANAGELKIQVNGVRNSSGSLVACIWRNAEGFPDCGAGGYLKKATVKADPANIIVFKDLPDGTYAVSLMHDENADWKLDKNIIGIPREGVAVSNNVRPRMAPPKFSDAVFTLKGEKSIAINMIYP